MTTSATWHFGAYRMLAEDGPLYRGDEEVKLTPKSLRVLATLLASAGEVVSKEALLAAAWPGTIVGEDALAFQIQALRHALADDARQPRFIATIHRVGFRFVAAVARGGALAALTTGHAELAAGFVGRTSELAELRAGYEQAKAGTRQVVFVTGGAGLGKTTLIEIFLARLGEVPLFGHGRALESRPAAAVHEAVTRLAAHPGVSEVLDGLAPRWAHGGPPRELADALGALAATRPVVLVLEDLHWSDPATVELLTMIARRRDPARLFVVASQRPVELIVADHPLKPAKHDLVARGLATEVVLAHLTPEEVTAFVVSRLAPELAESIFERTDGHPHVLAQIGGHLTSGVETWLPRGTLELVAAQLARLSDDDQRLLEVAAVAGVEVTLASVAAALDRPLSAVEERCEVLARRGLFLEDRGVTTWADGTISGHYGFRHRLYRDVLYHRVDPARRGQIEAAMATRERGAR